MKKWLLAWLTTVFIIALAACDTGEVPIRDIVGVEALPDMEVSTFTGFDMLGLPGQVQVTLDDGSETLVRLSWESARSVYDAAVPGTYILHAQPIATGRVTNQDGIEAVLKVVVAAGSLMETLENLGSYSIFMEMIETAGLVAMLETSENLTVFAPTDEAFNALFANFNLPRNMLMSLDQLDEIVLYHVLDRTRYYEALVDFAPMSLNTLSGDPISFALDGLNLVINDTAIVGAADRIFTNGLIHDLDGVLIPPTLLEDLLLDLIGDEMLETLFELLLESGLFFRLISGSRFTIFLPNEEAFAALASDLDLSLEAVLELQQLPDILAYHIIEGEYSLDDLYLSAPTTLPTLYGDASLAIEVIDDVTSVQGAHIVSSEQLMEFGIVHVIDRVLIPEDILAILFPE
ncbi:MAG: hypothetical protein EA374_00840 [Acholeplasmatales bacterium]|nr:MAG: hypothetical protein EA374_00840 [Acholeplasmatales bacterium]